MNLASGSLRRVGTLLALLAVATAAGATSEADTTSGYLIAFHACNRSTTNCDTPTNHMTYLAKSTTGSDVVPFTSFSSVQGSVPDVVRRGTTLYVYSPQKLRRYDLVTGTWSDAINVSMKTSDGVTEKYVDPSPMLDSDGKITLFYLVGTTSGDPATCASGQTSCTKIIRSATEVTGSNGASFIVDSGNRAEITVDTAGSTASASDPDIFADPNGYVLYVSRGSGVQALTSSTLRGTYSNVSGLTDGMLVATSGGIPAGHYDSATGKYWTYVTSNQSDGSQIVRRAVHSSLGTALTESSFSNFITGSSFTGLGSSYLVASPGIAINHPGTAQILGSTSGTSTALSLTAQLTIAQADAGASGYYYLFAYLAGQWFVNNGTTWNAWTGGTVPTYASGSLTDRSIAVLNGFNMTGLSGLTVYAGYGKTLEDMLQNTKYAAIYTAP